MFKSISSLQQSGVKLLQQKNLLLRPALQYRNYASANVFEVEADTLFKEQVEDASKNVPVLVDAYADWCGPCKVLAPVIERVVQGRDGKVKLAKVNVDNLQETAEKLGVQSIPAVFLFKNGKPVDYFIGNKREQDINAFLDKNL